jgi:hypothetical protein
MNAGPLPGLGIVVVLLGCFGAWVAARLYWPAPARIVPRTAVPSPDAVSLAFGRPSPARYRRMLELAERQVAAARSGTGAAPGSGRRSNAAIGPVRAPSMDRSAADRIARRLRLLRWSASLRESPWWPQADPRPTPGQPNSRFAARVDRVLGEVDGFVRREEPRR